MATCPPVHLGGGISRDAQLGLGTSNLLFLSWYVCMKFSKEKNPPNKINNNNSNNTSKDTRPWWLHLFPQVVYKYMWWCQRSWHLNTTVPVADSTLLLVLGRKFFSPEHVRRILCSLFYARSCSYCWRSGQRAWEHLEEKALVVLWGLFHLGNSLQPCKADNKIISK